MRRILLSTAAVALMSGAAFAADMPVFEPAPILAPVPVGYDWSGPYIGLFGGWAWADFELTDEDAYNGPPASFSYDDDGFYVGAFAGYNFHWNWLVLGAEAEIAWLDLDGSAQFPPYVGVRLPSDSRASTELGLYGAVTGRAGFAFNRVLIYGKGGVAFADAEVSFIDTDPTGITLVSGTSEDEWVAGWTAGGGVEVAVTQRFLVRGEYMFTDLGDVSHTALGSNGVSYTFDHDIENLHTFKIGAALKF